MSNIKQAAKRRLDELYESEDHSQLDELKASEALDKAKVRTRLNYRWLILNRIFNNRPWGGWLLNLLLVAIPTGAIIAVYYLGLMPVIHSFVSWLGPDNLTYIILLWLVLWKGTPLLRILERWLLGE